MNVPVLSRVAPAIRRMQLLLIVAGAAIGIDQISKWAVEASMELYESIPSVGHWFGLTRTMNTGAAFSMLQNGGVIFIVIAAVVFALCVAVAAYLVCRKRQKRGKDAKEVERADPSLAVCGSLCVCARA